MINLLSIEVRSARRVRVLFSNTLGSGAFGIPAPTFYSILSIDDVGNDPAIVAALIVPNSGNVVELVLDNDLVTGGRYTLSAVGVPDISAAVTPNPSQDAFYFGSRVGIGGNGEPFKAQQQRLLYGIDLIHNGADYEEAATGDLARVEGPANVTKALNHGIESAGLPWDPNYGGRAREFIDSPSAASGTLRGSVSAQMLKDPRVKSIRTTIDFEDASTFINITPTLITGEDILPVSISVPNAT